MATMSTTGAAAGAAAYNHGASTGDCTLVITAHTGDVWVGNAAFTVPSNWATWNASVVGAFRVAEGTTVTLPLENQEPLYIGAGPSVNARFSYCRTSV